MTERQVALLGSIGLLGMACNLWEFMWWNWYEKQKHLSTIHSFSQVILAGTLTGIYPRPFNSKILTWAGTALIDGCNWRNFLLFIHSNKVHIGEVSQACNRIKFCRDCKDWKYKDLNLKWCRRRIWLWDKMGRQNWTSKLNLIAC